MNAPRRYATAAAFRKALEDRLILLAQKENVDLQRLRREVAFDRILTRLFRSERPPWVLKGGYAMELRIREARATKDIDLALRGAIPTGKALPPDQTILEALREAAGLDLRDFFTFLIGGPMQALDAAPYGGARYPVETRMDGRSFVKFHIDVGVGDVVLEPLEFTEGRDWLAFAGIPGQRFPTISREQQFAEKLHAYTLPRARPNSRVRDLVDIVLLIKSGKMDSERVKKAVRATFERRGTHPVLAELSSPPTGWEKPYLALARECGLSEDLAEAFRLFDSFYSSL